MIRALSVLAGIGVIAAATHWNVMHAGGYRSDAAALLITLAVLLAVGMAFVGYTFAEGRWAWAIALMLCLVAGEAYWLFTNAERELAARDAQNRPAVELEAKRAAAKQRLDDAKAAKEKADTAATSEASKKDCLKNCAAILMQQQETANAELVKAREAYQAVPLPITTAALPARLGIADWIWDLVMAGLRSLAVVGASIAVGLAIHPRKVVVNDILDTFDLPPASNVVPITKPKQKKPATGSVAKFLAERIEAAPGGRLDIEKLWDGYRAWCAETKQPSAHLFDFGDEVVAVSKKAGIKIKGEGDNVYFADVKLAS